MLILFSNAVTRSSVSILCMGFRRFRISVLNVVSSFFCNLSRCCGAITVVVCADVCFLIPFSSVVFFVLLALFRRWVFNCLMKS